MRENIGKERSERKKKREPGEEREKTEIEGEIETLWEKYKKREKNISSVWKKKSTVLDLTRVDEKF